MKCSIGKLVAGDLLAESVHSEPAELNELLQTLLFSQLFANLKSGSSGKFDSPGTWWSSYDNAMLHTHWSLLDNRNRTFKPKSTSTLGINALLEEFLLPQLASAQTQDIRQLLTQMTRLPTTDPLAMQFQTHVLKMPDRRNGHSTIALQIGVLESATQRASLSATFSTSKAVGTSLLSQTFTGSQIVGDIHVRFTRYAWDPASYRKGTEEHPSPRSHVLDFLAGAQDRLILAIPCEVTDGADQA
ncbi:hypothetical protein NJC40_24680 [Pseudomonas sp. 21LCFQ02]|uniref:hypothetical protein n=1 Tax=Pseudomonas sp. 21LCFQ02 TaxID=2957505 RepID=UPI00209A7445|nr:hypothetical protein [Pseudomonas sp. 21LCFQ02]MCO8170967.1 hypothetical protein [Pseudomonas sp. 21LCFQ02]